MALPRVAPPLTPEASANPLRARPRTGRLRRSAVGSKMRARLSTPSTSRGPGRANDALASTAHTGICAGSTPDVHHARAPAPSNRRGRSRRARRPRRRARLASAWSHVTRTDFSPGRTDGGYAARDRDHLGNPVAGREGRVGPLQQQHRGTLTAGRAATCARTASSRASQGGHQALRPRPGGPWPTRAP